MSQIYKSDDWKSLDSMIRAHLLLVIEGVKPGVMTKGNYGFFQRILTKAGLASIPTNKKYDIRLSARVARPDVLNDHIGNLILAPKRAGDLYFYINGEFLGYPKCCVDEYSRPRTIEELELEKSKKFELSYTFGRELHEMIEKEGTYDELFDYVIPSFTPCSINCENAKSVLASWRDVLHKYDPGAEEDLLLFSRGGGDKLKIHSEFVNKHRQSRELLNRENYLNERKSWLSGENNHLFNELLEKKKKRSNY